MKIRFRSDPKLINFLRKYILLGPIDVPGKSTEKCPDLMREHLSPEPNFKDPKNERAIKRRLRQMEAK